RRAGCARTRGGAAPPAAGVARVRWRHGPVPAGTDRDRPRRRLLGALRVEGGAPVLAPGEGRRRRLRRRLRRALRPPGIAAHGCERGLGPPDRAAAPLRRAPTRRGRPGTALARRAHRGGALLPGARGLPVDDDRRPRRARARRDRRGSRGREDRASRGSRVLRSRIGLTVLERLLAWLRGDVSASALDRERNRCVDAYDLVEQLPNGAARAAA